MNDPQTRCPYCYSRRTVVNLGNGWWKCNKCKKEFRLTNADPAPASAAEGERVRG